MKKEELIKNLEKINALLPRDIDDQYSVGRSDAYTQAVRLIRKLDEPEIPAIPQFVADYIEKQDDPIFNLCVDCEMYGSDGEVTSGFTPDLVQWFKDNAKIYYRACQDGYTIEPVKTRQVLVKFFDNEEYKTELTEDTARELIEFLEANKHE